MRQVVRMQGGILALYPNELGPHGFVAILLQPVRIDQPVRIIIRLGPDGIE